MLTHADEQHRHVRGVHETDERAHHVAHGVALGDDEAVKGTDGAEGSVEVARLGNGVGANKSLRVDDLLAYEKWKRG